MSLLASEGFGWSTTAADYAAYGSFVTGPASISTGGPLGDNFAGLGSGTMLWSVPTTSATFFFGWRFNNNGLVADTITIDFKDGSGVQMRLQYVCSTGAVSLARGTATNIGSLAGSGIPTTGFCYLEAGSFISATVGTFFLRLNGVTIWSLTGLNNKGSATSTITQVSMTTNTGTQVSFAHLYLCDDTGSGPWNTFLGDVRVQTLIPTSNDAVNFTPNGLANNWQNAAKIPPVPATDFNSDSTVGDQDTFNCGTISASTTTVFGVCVKDILLKSDAGARSGETILKSGATQVAGASTALSTSGQQLRTMYQTDPNTSAQWTVANVNAAKPGYAVSA